jgi:hypothetical protein
MMVSVMATRRMKDEEEEDEDGEDSDDPDAQLFKGQKL